MQSEPSRDMDRSHDRYGRAERRGEPLGYARSLLSGLLICAVLTLQRIGAVGVWVALADGLFVSGALLVSLYLLGAVSFRGGFDIFFYSLGMLFSVRRSSERGYAEYKRTKTRKAPKRAGLFAGLLLLLLSIPICAAAMIL